MFPVHTGTRLVEAGWLGLSLPVWGSFEGALLTWGAWPSSQLLRRQPEASWSWGHQPVVENHPSLALSHAIPIQTGIKAGGKLHRPGGGAPGAGLGDSYCTMSHSYYIRADQEHSNATQAQICPHRLGRGCQQETRQETCPGISRTIWPHSSEVPFVYPPRTMSSSLSPYSSLMWLQLETDS